MPEVEELGAGRFVEYRLEFEFPSVDSLMAERFGEGEGFLFGDIENVRRKVFGNLFPLENFSPFWEIFCVDDDDDDDVVAEIWGK